MKLHHVAIWVSDLEAAAAFWRTYFGASIGELHRSERQIGFTLRFAVVGDAGLRLDLMNKPSLPAVQPDSIGWAHIAISVGSQAAVDALAARFAAENRLALGPRTTGDGFYEAMVRGPDDLSIEITI